MIAHFRLLVTGEELQQFKAASEAELLTLVAMVTRAMREYPLVLPTLEQVLVADSKIQSTAEQEQETSTGGTIHSATSPTA
jgi:hypothetical protein